MAARDVAIVAYGETKIERRSGKTPYELAAICMEEILGKTGLKPADIDGFATNVAHSDSINQYYTTYLCDYLGLTPRWMQVSDHGGGAALAGLSRAVMAVQAGQCEIALVLCSDSPTTVWRGANGGFRLEWWDPTGIQGPPGGFGLLMHRYMAQYQLESKALGKLAVAQREGAVLNPLAFEGFRKPLTIQDYLDSRVISTPLRLLDCVMWCDGAAGVLVTSVERAKKIKGAKRIFPTAYSEIVNFNGREAQPDITESGFSVVGPEALQKAGLKPSDIRQFQPYDDFLIAEMIQLEQIGFCRRGQGSEFLLNTDVSYRGTLPINTGGGQISAGQIGLASGMTNLVEAVRQMCGEAGERQITDPRNAMVTGIGIIPYGRNWYVSIAAILEH
ncbi:MAG: thiolase family protein [Alphaproteobacteria bacterium]|nr:thiolase family protein [Alphaproteobacteria bacterium]